MASGPLQLQLIMSVSVCEPPVIGMRAPRAVGSAAPSPARAQQPTIWGLSVVQLHDHFWAGRGVFVVRRGEKRDLSPDAELFLLTDSQTLCIFRLASLIETLSWVQPSVMFLRLVVRQAEGYRESVVTDEAGRFLRFRRSYGMVLPRLARVALTRDPRVAYAWQAATDTRTAWKRLRREARATRSETASLRGRVYDRGSDEELAKFVSDLTRYWKRPSATVNDINKSSPDVWIHDTVKIEPDVRFIGPVWVGAGRSIEAGATVLGPAVLWDDPASRPQVADVRWAELEPARVLAVVRQATARRTATKSPRGKRFFDILFALMVLLATLPLYPLIMLAIWLEDGRPFFFVHARETLGGREFGCIKFRSMRRDAEAMRESLAVVNRADGPQFYLTQDPRLTQIGRFLRKTNIDELPQFINVLLGDMSVVGPRPSPRSENQYSPAWREARLSVRAGITGLWQVSRTRRPGLDFQEWIKYDLDYVRNPSWRTEIRIILSTLRVLFKK